MPELCSFAALPLIEFGVRTMATGRRKRILILIVAWLYALGTIWFVIANWGYEYRDPRTLVFIGETESQIRRSNGTPVSQYEDYLPLGRRGEYRSGSPGTYRTLVFDLRDCFRRERGTLYVWFQRRGDEWVCIAATLVPENVTIGQIPLPSLACTTCATDIPCSWRLRNG